MPILFSCAIAFAATVICIQLLRPLAIRLKLVDPPGGRKQHEGYIPLVGGIAIFLGFLFALLTLSISLSNYRGFLAGCALLVFVGVLDDFHELSARSRFIAQIIAALLMTAWSGVSLQHLGDLFFYKDIVLNGWGLPVTVLAVVGVINAINMTDGLDGLAGGLSLISLSFLLLLAGYGGQIFAMNILALLIAAVLAFLIFNFPVPSLMGRNRNLVFMGDAGSMLLGFALVWFLVELSQGPKPAASPTNMLWILAVPLLDITGVVIRRLQKRKSPFSPDREHFHHILQDKGFSKTQVTWIICGVAFFCGLIGFTAARLKVSDSLMFVGFVILFAVYLWVLNFWRCDVKQ